MSEDGFLPRCGFSLPQPLPLGGGPDGFLPSGED